MNIFEIHNFGFKAKFDFSGPPKFVRLGDLDIARTDDVAEPQEYRIVRTIPHPNYKQPKKYHDIALIEIDSDIELTEYVGVGCLDTASKHTEDSMIATGWGQTEFAGVSSSHLLKANLNIVNNNRCRQLYRSDRSKLPEGVKDEIMICAGGKSDTCPVSN